MKKLIIMALFLVGCEKNNNNTTVQYCSVSKLENYALIKCPDGSEITVPPEIISEVIEVTREVPVVIDVNIEHKCKGHK